VQGSVEADPVLMTGRMGRRAQAAKFRQAQEGATAIEFALVALPFFFVVGIIIEMGIMTLAESELHDAVNKASRTISTGNATMMTGSQFRDEICNRVNTISNCNTRLGLTVISASTFGNLAVPAIGNIGFQPAPNFQPGGAEDAVAVVATYDWQIVFPFMRALSNMPAGDVRRLHGMAVFMNEPW
jgi:Flp pilus assembly protein TadG